MSNTTIALRSSGATGNVPNALSLAYGEFALNYADGIIYYRTDSDTVGSILTTQPSGLDKEIQFNDLGSFGSSANLSFNKTTGLFSTSRIYVSANAQIVGNVTASKLISNNSIGDSGGEVLLALPAANTTLSGLGITIDAFQNKIRFYEQGGTNRGAYIDLTEAAANVGTNLLTAGSGSGNNALQYRSSYTANSGQTSFDATYIPGYVDTFINGVKLTPGTDFTATNGTTITLSEGAVANDSVEIIGYVTVSTTLPDAIQRRYSYTANAAQTTFAAVYVPPYVDVYKNGVRLSPTTNYTAINGAEVVLTAGAALDDLIEIVGYSSYTATVAQADQLTTGRTIAMTGDVTWTSNSFNGAANVTGTSTLANTGVTAGTYTKVTVDAKGRVTTGNTLSYSDLPTYSGNLVFTGTGNRILGDFSNATSASRVMFQTSTVNGLTAIGAIPNGTSNDSRFIVYSNSDPNNSSVGQVMFSGTSDFSIRSGANGTGTNLPMTFFTGGSERVRIDTSGNVGIGTTTTSLARLIYSGSFNAGSAGSFPSALGSGSYGGGIGFYDGGVVSGMYVQDTGTTMHLFTGQTASDTSAGKIKMTLNATGVGIGTSTPAYKLDLQGGRSVLSPNSEQYALGLRYNTSTNGVWLGSPSANAFAVYNFGGGEYLRIDSSGNLLVGTSSSPKNWGTASPKMRVTAGGIQVGDYSLIAEDVFDVDSLCLVADSTESICFGQYTTTGSQYTERARFDASGNFLVGLTSAQGKASIGLASTTNAITDLANFPTASRVILGDTSGGGGNSKMFFGAGFSSNGAGLNAGFGFIRENSGTWGTALTFYTHPTSTANEDELIERARIDSSGNFTLGNGGILYLENTSQFIRGGGSTQVIVGASSGGFYQQVGGSYYLVTTAGGSTSDASLKTNVQQLTGALDKVCAIRGVNFEFLEHPMCTADQGTQLGVIAQEVEAQYPEIVLTDEDGKKTVRYDRLVAPLIEAIKEQQAIITALTARVAALESN